jgi:monoterpene epsilon-lactone hydrolase
MIGAMGRAAMRRLASGPIRASWSWRVELTAAAMRAVLMQSKTRGPLWLRSALEVTPNPSPFAKRVRTEDVDANGVRARWFVPLGQTPTRTIVYFHGGGFVIGSLDTHVDPMARLAILTGARVLGVDYRLAPEHRFPAAHDDALAATRWVLASGADPRSVALAGDSAGGNLAVATLCSLRDAGDRLPAAAALLCPWVDPPWEGGSMDANADADFGDRSLLYGWFLDYVPGGARDPRVCPIDAKLEGLPPLLVQVGGGELLLDQCKVFAERARQAGVDVTLTVEGELFHDWQLQAQLLPEGARSMEEIARFFQARLAG